jgi:hypothetical protein
MLYNRIHEGNETEASYTSFMKAEVTRMGVFLGPAGGTDGSVGVMWMNYGSVGIEGYKSSYISGRRRSVCQK